MKIDIQKQPKSTLKLSISVEKEKVKEAYTKLLDAKVQTTTVDGFRVGKAPKDKVEAKIGVSNLYGEVINVLLETYYTQALKEKLIYPVSNPRVEIKEFDLEKDFEFTVLVAVRPEIKIGDYKAKLKKYYEEKNKEIAKEDSHVHAHIHSSEIIEKIIEASEVEVADLLLEEETNRMMARMINQTETLGMSMDAYLKAINKTSEEIKTEYSKAAEKNLKAEFVLSEIVKNEKIEVKDEEIFEAVKAAGSENPEKELADPIQKFYIKSVLEKNKLISNIIKEIEGENSHE